MIPTKQLRKEQRLHMELGKLKANEEILSLTNKFHLERYQTKAR
jgi:hypothetical protein